MKHFRLLTMAFCALLGLSANAQKDITNDYLQNADLSTVGSGWNYGDDGYNYEVWETSGSVPVVEFYYQWSSNPGVAIGSTRNFHFTQEVTLPAGSYRLAVNGFYREGNGNGTSKAFIFISDANADPANPVYLAQKDMHGLTAAEQADVSNSNGSNHYTGGSDRLRAANAFSKGDFSNEFDFDLEHEQRVIIGFRGYIDTYCSWCILGPVKLFQYNLSDYLVAYDQKVAEAEALLNNTVLSADAVSKGETVQIDASAAGGLAPYTYAYFYKLSTKGSWNKLSDGYISDTSSSVKLGKVGTYNIKVITKDSAGTKAEKIFTVDVT